MLLELLSLPRISVTGRARFVLADGAGRANNGEQHVARTLKQAGYTVLTDVTVQ